MIAFNRIGHQNTACRLPGFHNQHQNNPAPKTGQAVQNKFDGACGQRRCVGGTLEGRIFGHGSGNIREITEIIPVRVIVKSDFVRNPKRNVHHWNATGRGLQMTALIVKKHVRLQDGQYSGLVHAAEKERLIG